jgi:hypothetical protein
MEVSLDFFLFYFFFGWGEGVIYFDGRSTLDFINDPHLDISAGSSYSFRRVPEHNQVFLPSFRPAPPRRFGGTLPSRMRRATMEGGGGEQRWDGVIRRVLDGQKKKETDSAAALDSLT